jgi:hypothetical protein
MITSQIITRSRLVFRRVAAVAAGVAMSAGLAVGLAPTASAAERPCVEGSRKINAPGAAVEVQTVQSIGGRGIAQITLRRLPAENCYWGLLEGPGDIWLQRVSWYDVGNKNPDFVLYRRTNKGDGVTHTAATITTEHSVRACGRAYSGSETDESSIGASIGMSGKTPSGEISAGRSWVDTYTFDTGIVCTEWAHADTILPNF